MARSSEYLTGTPVSVPFAMVTEVVPRVISERMPPPVSGHQRLRKRFDK
jgi:hypothetical protein